MTLPHPFIKICSLREPHQAEFAVAAGASAVGFIFADARRRVTVDHAREIVGELRRLDADGRILAVGVFVDQSADEVNRTADAVGLNVVQLHGAEPPDVLARLERPVLKVVRGTEADAAGSITAYEQSNAAPVAYLVDGTSKDAAGGTGTRADWQAAMELARATRLILAGGLTPENVCEAIRVVRPLGVDVSSGVETDGAKDRAKVIAFARTARAAVARLEEEPAGSWDRLEIGEGGVVPVA